MFLLLEATGPLSVCVCERESCVVGGFQLRQDGGNERRILAGVAFYDALYVCRLGRYYTIEYISRIVQRLYQPM